MVYRVRVRYSRIWRLAGPSRRSKIVQSPQTRIALRCNQVRSSRTIFSHLSADACRHWGGPRFPPFETSIG